MQTDHRARLASIKRFDQLIAYLRDDMGWPIHSDDFEELTFEYTPEELGIDLKNSAKIQEIKRLRPLVANQPWGIFFVKFEPKKLPVIALRRILGQVALKKRASANSAERQAWAADDLLFVSNYGEGDERQISLAHFARAQDGQDLPTLKVLGWDNRDTALHLDAVVGELTLHLAWPDDDSNVDAWRERWRAAFTLGHREVITTSKQLSLRLAELARHIRDRIRTALVIETAKGPLTQLMKAFQTALLHDLDSDSFADMYAQTIAYGLLSARITDPQKKTADDFAAHMRTNPFLRELMETFLKVGGRRGKTDGTGIDFDELGVSEVVDLLDDANMEAVIRDFGDRNPQEDPVIHFYELFLKEYDAKKRMQRGVFYTPCPVVSYIVRSVDELLRTEFGLEDGLADTTTWGEMAERHKNLKIPGGGSPDQAFVQILDPATGTGTFLVEVIDLIYSTLRSKWEKEADGPLLADVEGRWNEYVPKHLLPRLHGYEILMAPYAIAHLKIGLKLHETGYRFGSEERARIYLTNALEPSSDFSGTFEFAIPALAHEAAAVNEIKRHKCFTVVLGNPPYSGHSTNTGGWIQHILRSSLKDDARSYFEVDGLPLDERNPKWLNDDYVKFIRFGQHVIAGTGTGIVGFITNHSFLDNPTFRGMRQSLMQSFDRGLVIDLAGNVKKAFTSGFDQNVFDIQQGVAIGFWRKIGSPKRKASVYRAELMGARSTKYEFLLNHALLDTTSSEIYPVSPFYLFVQQKADIRTEFLSHFSVNELFPVSTMGVTTGRDQLSVSFSKSEALEKMTEFTSGCAEDELFRRFGLSNKSGWNIQKARSTVRVHGVSAKYCTQFLYRPFDERFLYLNSAIVGRPRSEGMRHMSSGSNLGLCTTRQVNGDFRHSYCSRVSVNDCVLSNASGERAYLFPLYVLLNEGELKFSSTKSLNISTNFLIALCSRLQMKPGPLGFPPGLTPEDIFCYAYTMFHSPGYRSRYADFLKIDFPRLPLTSSLDLFLALAKLGGELVALHLLESSKLNNFITTFTGPNSPEVGRVGWSDETVWLDAAATKKGQPAKPGTIGFRGVPEDVWNFHIGGYQVCHKWLKDRKGRTLSDEDIAHYQKIVVALAETIRLMKEIDEVIEKHGGWPIK